MNSVYTILLDHVRNSSEVAMILDNHGYFRHSYGHNLVFFPKNPGNKFHSIGLTPGLNQSPEQINKDVAKSRIMLVAEAMNSDGAYVILEDDTGYMTITGDLHDDLVTFCRRVVKAIIHVTGEAESLGMTPHDYVTKIAD